MQKLGGRLVGLYYCFGEYDGVVLAELSDDSAATALAMAAMSSGHLTVYKTTKLFTVEETIEAMCKTGSLRSRGQSEDSPGGRWHPAAGLLPRAFPIVSFRATK